MQMLTWLWYLRELRALSRDCATGHPCSCIAAVEHLLVIALIAAMIQDCTNTTNRIEAYDYHLRRWHPYYTAWRRSRLLSIS